MKSQTVMLTRRCEIILLCSLITGYLFISTRHLGIVPPVFEDEPWQASTAWKLATQGVFGTDLFSGFYGMERHVYNFMPLHPLFLAVDFKLAGPGIVQARLETVAMGLATLLLTYWLGKRLFCPAVGLLAVALLLLVRTSIPDTYHLTGILFLDIARIARYDALVPVFGLGALHAYLSARRSNSWRFYLLAGMLAGIAGLAHVYGLFWFPALILLAIWDRAGWRAAGTMFLGLALPFIPYFAYVLAGTSDWIGQTREYSPRFQFTDPAWYLSNLRSESDRYRLVLWPIRPGAWLAYFGSLLGVLALAYQAIKRHAIDARTLLVPAILLPGFFALLLSVKYLGYTFALLPLYALVIAWGAASLWGWALRSKAKPVVHAALIALLLAVAVEGISRVALLERAASRTTPYASYIAQVRAKIVQTGISPSVTRVLGLHTYWFGLQDFDYRSWLLPVYESNPRNMAEPLSIEQALEDLHPDIILVDRHMRQYLLSPQPGDDLPARILAWMDSQGYLLVAQVPDQTYGKMDVYQKQP